MRLQPHIARVLAKLWPRGLCPGAQGRRAVVVGVLCSGVSGHLLCEDRVLPLPGRELTGGAGAIAGRQQPCLPWEGAAAGALGRGAGVVPGLPA